MYCSYLIYNIPFGPFIIFRNITVLSVVFIIYIFLFSALLYMFNMYCGLYAQFHSAHTHMYIYDYIYVCVCVCVGGLVCVCVQ